MTGDGKGQRETGGSQAEANLACIPPVLRRKGETRRDPTWPLPLSLVPPFHFIGEKRREGHRRENTRKENHNTEEENTNQTEEDRRRKENGGWPQLGFSLSRVAPSFPQTMFPDASRVPKQFQTLFLGGRRRRRRIEKRGWLMRAPIWLLSLSLSLSLSLCFALPLPKKEREDSMAQLCFSLSRVAPSFPSQCF